MNRTVDQFSICARGERTASPGGFKYFRRVLIAPPYGGQSVITERVYKSLGPKMCWGGLAWSGQCIALYTSPSGGSLVPNIQSHQV